MEVNSNLNKNVKIKKIIYILIYIIYALLNYFLVLCHEPWRDEIHQWLLAKNLSIKELFIESKFDGHPILWSLTLKPFAENNFSILYLNLFSYIIVMISAYIFLFRIKLPIIIKILSLFTVPFTYTYSAISRNYCLVLLFLIIISTMYDKRYEKPILYSIAICFLIFTHSLAWGVVAGLTITFHFEEIFLFFKKKNKSDIKKVIIGLSLIVFCTILIIFQLYGTTNEDYKVSLNYNTIYTIGIIIFLSYFIIIYSLFFKENYRESIIVLLGFAFQLYIYLFFNSLVILQRYMLIFVLLLFFVILVSKSENKEVNFSKKVYILGFGYLIIILLFSVWILFYEIYYDIKMPYSSAKQMAEYINSNVNTDTILVDSSIIEQSIIPYLKNTKLYDITDKKFLTCAEHASYNEEKIIKALNNIDKDNKYRGCYLIINNDIVDLSDKYQLIYRTEESIKNECFTLYYIP